MLLESPISSKVPVPLESRLATSLAMHEDGYVKAGGRQMAGDAVSGHDGYDSSFG